MSVLEKSKAYKPFKYPWAYEIFRMQHQMHWLPEEVSLGDDVKDWKSLLNENEKDFLTHIFRFFTQADIDVASGYTQHYMPMFRATEISMMLTSFASMEGVHIDAYSKLIETLGMPDSTFTQFMEYDVMVKKHEYVTAFNMDSPRDILKSIAVYSAFIEGLQLFGSFAMLLNFSRFGKMKGMGQIVTWSVRDESLHTYGMIKLFHEYALECGCYDDNMKNDIKVIARDIVKLEDMFIDLAFDMGEQKGLTKDHVKKYIRYLCDYRLGELHIQPIYNVDKHPLPWLREMLGCTEHANFFESTATEYSKSATKGTWHDVWEKFR